MFDEVDVDQAAREWRRIEQEDVGVRLAQGADGWGMLPTHIQDRYRAKARRVLNVVAALWQEADARG